ncbi:MAG: hypothetical protein IT446_10030 [Phycisphaerales bacterium]|nr:hypothetical protein [Phycisphaerales bacterium]
MTTKCLSWIWSSQAQGSRAAELFMPQQTLAPGQQWQVTVHYRAFAPSDPDTGDASLDRLLARPAVEDTLHRQSSPSMRPLPYESRLVIPIGNLPATLVPVGATDETDLYQTSTHDAAQMTLQHISLAGTPGEMTPFAFRLRAIQPVRNGTVSLAALSGDAGVIDAGAFDPRYLSSRGNYLVHDWNIARETPEAMAAIGNQLRGSDQLTPFSLPAGGSGLVWVYLRVPDSAKPGLYHGRCTVNMDGVATAFDIELTVRPFTLQRPINKNYGSFFRYYLPGDVNANAAEPQAGLTSREAYRAALETLDEAGYDSLVIYVSARDDILWVLDQCVDLGWTHGTFVLISPWSVKPEELQQRYGQYDMKFLAWGVDEPSLERQIPQVLSSYDRIIEAGYTPTFTPNVPLGLLMADSLKQIVPIIAISGNAPYLFDATRRYHDEGRKVYWYRPGMGQPSLDKRLTRGIYFWMEPVDGVIDWGEDAAYTQISVDQTVGFIGEQTVPTVGRENVRQGLYDMYYLYTLQQHLKTSKNPDAVRKGEALLQWVRRYFAPDWHEVARRIGGPQYLASLREQISNCIVELDQTSNPENSR